MNLELMYRLLEHPMEPVIEYSHSRIDAERMMTVDGQAPAGMGLAIAGYHAPHIDLYYRWCDWARHLLGACPPRSACLMRGDRPLFWQPDDGFHAIFCPPRQSLDLMLRAGVDPIPAGTVTLLGWRVPEK